VAVREPRVRDREAGADATAFSRSPCSALRRQGRLRIAGLRF